MTLYWVIHNVVKRPTQYEAIMDVQCTPINPALYPALWRSGQADRTMSAAKERQPSTIYTPAPLVVGDLLAQGNALLDQYATPDPASPVDDYSAIYALIVAWKNAATGAPKTAALNAITGYMAAHPPMMGS